MVSEDRRRRHKARLKPRFRVACLHVDMFTCWRCMIHMHQPARPTRLASQSIPSYGTELVLRQYMWNCAVGYWYLDALLTFRKRKHYATTLPPCGTSAIQKYSWAISLSSRGGLCDITKLRTMKRVSEALWGQFRYKMLQQGNWSLISQGIHPIAVEIQSKYYQIPPSWLRSMSILDTLIGINSMHAWRNGSLGRLGQPQ